MTDAEDVFPCFCGQEEALPGAFLGPLCCPEPEQAPEPVAWQPGLFVERAAA